MKSRRPGIVLIEDDLATRELYQRELAVEYTVYPCANLDNARAIVEMHEIHLMLIEPVGCGWEALDIVDRTVPVLVCTTADAVAREIRVRLAAYLVKPVLPSVLRHQVRLALERGVDTSARGEDVGTWRRR